MVQGFSQKSEVRRDGQEILGYTAIAADKAAAKAHPDLVGVLAPTFIGASFFEQKKTREGGAFDIEFKPNKDLTLDLNGFYSQLKAPHSNTNHLAAPSGSINAGMVPTSYTVRNNTLVAANFTQNAGEVDNIYRPDAGGETYYLDFNFKYRASKDLTFTGKLGKTHGVGYDRDDVYYQNKVDGGMNYALNGMSPATVAYPGGTTTAPLGTAWIGGGESQSVDKELYTQIDGELRLSNGIWDSVKFGARFTDHKRTAEHPFETGPGATGLNSAGPIWNGTQYPSNFASNLGGNLPTNYFRYDGDALAKWAAIPGNRNPDRVARHNWRDEFKLQEKPRQSTVWPIWLAMTGAVTSACAQSVPSSPLLSIPAVVRSRVPRLAPTRKTPSSAPITTSCRAPTSSLMSTAISLCARPWPRPLRVLTIVRWAVP